MNWNSFVDELGRAKDDFDRNRLEYALGAGSPHAAGPRIPGVMVRTQHSDGSMTLNEVVRVEFDGDDVVITAREGLSFDWRNR